MNTTSIRQLAMATSLLLTASCVALLDDEGALSDEGCIIDVRPKPLHPSMLREYDKDHYVDVYYAPGAGHSVDFFITAAKAGSYVGIKNVKNDNDYTELEVGDNVVTLRFGPNAVVLEHKVGGKVKKTLQNHMLDKGPMKGKIKKPKPQKLAKKNDLDVMQINFEAFGLASGFTILGKELLEEPRWVGKDHPEMDSVTGTSQPGVIE